MRKIALLLLLTACYLLPTAISAQTVDILWQGSTYTPPFYEGLPLWSNQSRVTLVAIPHIPGMSGGGLVYRWSKNGTVIGASSGVNRTSFVLDDTVLSKPVEVKIDVFREIGESPLGSASLVLKPTTARALVYENNPLYGLLSNRAVSQEFVLREDEVTFSAIPLFSPVTMRGAPVLTYTWTTNTGDKRGAKDVTYRVPEEGSGTAQINLRVSNSQVIVEPEDKNFLIKFSQGNAI